MSARGRKRQFADPTDHSILTAEIPSPAVTAVVTDLPFAG